uniref:Ras association domain-containing protein 8 n=1 Tax=Anopheles farauti TaxID=69004 RepID=A0A182Q9W4_9DIPT
MPHTSSSSSSNASSNNTSTSSGIGGSGGSGASGSSGHSHHQTQQQPQQPQQQQQQPVEATYACVIKKPKSNASATSTNNVVGEFNAADLRSSLDRKVNGFVFSNGLNERVTTSPSAATATSAVGQQPPPASIIVGATLKQQDHPHLGGTIGRPAHFHHTTQLQNLLCTDNQHQQHQHLDTSSVSSISSSSIGGGNSNLTSLLNGSGGGGGGVGSTTHSPITGISSNGALVPPPYRDPPPPRNSPLSHTLTSLSSTGSGSGTGRRHEKDGGGPSAGGSSSASSTVSSLVVVGAGPGGLEEDGRPPDGLTTAGGPHVTGYRELMQLIKLQREKINTQQADLTKYDTEIGYLESRSREQTDQLDALTQEINKTEQQYRQTGDALQAFQYVEEESELVRQQEKTLKSEITLLRSKLANCETELLQCKNKIRLLMDEILVEQRKYSRQYDPNRQQLLERALMCEVDRLQVEIDLAVQSADQANKTHDKLKGEVTLLEGAIADKKKQVEKLVHEMKEVNLQSLAVVPPADEVRHLLEVGSVKPGSTRRMIGSPRQLENAVPTSKNPHGVWV